MVVYGKSFLSLNVPGFRVSLILVYPDAEASPACQFFGLSGEVAQLQVGRVWLDDEYTLAEGRECLLTLLPDFLLVFLLSLGDERNERFTSDYARIRVNLSVQMCQMGIYIRWHNLSPIVLETGDFGSCRVAAARAFFTLLCHSAAAWFGHFVAALGAVNGGVYPSLHTALFDALAANGARVRIYFANIGIRIQTA